MSSVIKPSTTPRWATSPPGNTIVEPSSPELDAGFQPGSQAQIVDFTIINVLSGHDYNATINGVPATYHSDGSATATEIRVGLAAEVTGLGVVTAVDTGAAVRVTANTPGQAFVPTTSDPTNVSFATFQANKSGKPIRQFVNWLFYWITQWIIYIASAMFDWSDVGSNFAVPGTGSLPTTGASLNGISGKGPAYVNGRRVPGPIEAKLFPIFSDTYIDLDQNNVWHYTAVSNGDPAPAVFANSLRMFMVVTNLNTRTSVVDLRVAKVPVRQVVSFDKKVYLGANTAVAEAGTSRTYNVTSEKYTIQEEIIPAAGGGGDPVVRSFTDFDGASVLTTNCYWDQTLNSGIGKWVADADGVAYLIGFTATGEIISRRMPAAVAASPWNDTISPFSGGWDSGFLSLEAIIELQQTSPLAPAFFSQVALKSGQRVQLLGTLSPFDSGVKSVSVWVTALGTDNQGPAIEITYNARWNGTQWERQAAGDAFKTDIGALGGGPRQLKHLAGDASPWNDTVAAGAWADPYTVHYHSFTGMDAGGLTRNNPDPFGDSIFAGQTIMSTALAAGGTIQTTVEIEANSAGEYQLWIPLCLPNAELVTDCKIRIFVGAAGTPHCRAALVRRTVLSDTETLKTLKSGDGVDTINGSASWQTVSLTLDGSVGDRTVDNSAFSYGLLVSNANTGNAVILAGGVVTTQIIRS